jgi:predicted dehydrogenase
VYGDNQIIQVQYDTPYIRNSPIKFILTEDNGRGGMTTITSRPTWGDPFVNEWEAFYHHVTTGTQPKTNPTDFVQDLELFAEMIRLMRDR